MKLQVILNIDEEQKNLIIVYKDEIEGINKVCSNIIQLTEKEEKIIDDLKEASINFIKS